MRAALMVHYLERISDHGVDIGGSTVFLVTGSGSKTPCNSIWNGTWTRSNADTRSPLVFGLTSRKHALNAAEILIVENNEVIMSTLALNLSQEGYGVKGATTGARALRLARKLRPDLILLDIMLPDELGIEVCGRIPAIGYVAVARGPYRLSSTNELSRNP